MNEPEQMCIAGVAAILLNTRGQVLLQQRDDKPDLPYSGYWTLPGGRVEAGESPEDAIQRELVEEIGLSVPLALWRAYEHPGPGQIPLLQYIYRGRTDQPIASLQRNEGQGLRYVFPGDIAGLPIAYGFNRLLSEFFDLAASKQRSGR